MEDYQRFLNPWVLHLQKLSLELKCPLCLNLLNRPMLLPCNHIFCKYCIPKSNQFGSECPACKHQYLDREIRPAPYMENMVNIYRSMDATFNANLISPFSSDAGRVSEKCHVSVMTSADDKFKMEQFETPQERISSSGKFKCSLMSNKRVHVSPTNCAVDGTKSTGNFDKSALLNSNAKTEFEMPGNCGSLSRGKDDAIPLQCPGEVRAEKHQELVREVMDMDQVEQLSLSSPPSFGDTKDMTDSGSDPGSCNGSVEKHPEKTSAENNLGKSEPNKRCTSKAEGHTRDVKRQKTITNLSSEMIVEINAHTQPKNLHSEATANSGSTDINKSVCAFCHCTEVTDGTGPMVSYAKGKEVVGDAPTSSKVIHGHLKCIDWAPLVYYEGDTVVNLESEVARATKLKCSSCGLKGAALGCYVNSCRRTYHVPCALALDCSWDCERRAMWCQTHMSKNRSREKSKSGKPVAGQKHHVPTQMVSKQPDFLATSTTGANKLVFCGSALSGEEKYHLVKVASDCGATVSKCWKPDVTHVIAATDSNGACARTLKVLMAILKGSWILTVDWLKACNEANQLVNEEPYEVRLDTHGCFGGPKNGRLRAFENVQKLFDGFYFYFNGEFVPAYKNDLLSLVKTAGGTVIESKDQLVALSYGGQVTPKTLVVYNLDRPKGCSLEDEGSIMLQRLEQAEDLADKIGSQVIGHTWILESIAACKLQPLCEH